MSHVWCIDCHGNDHICGYGLGAGGFSAYTICECGALLEQVPFDDDECKLPLDKRTPHGLDFVGGNGE